MAILIHKQVYKKLLQPVTLFALLLFAFPAKADQIFSDIFIFGDSMSDTGNLASIIGDFPPAYYNNRMSNGPVAVEILGERLGLRTDASLYLINQNAGTNYAVASAKAGGNRALDLDTQVNAFLSAHGFSAPQDALYVMFIGGNDVRGARDLDDNRLAEDVLKTAAENIRWNINKLVSSGAQFFVVMNSIDMGSIPEALRLDDPALSPRTTKLTQRFNRFLKKNIHDIEDDLGMEIAEFNSFKFLRRVIERAESFGFRNTREPCFFFSTLTFHPDCNFGKNSNDFLFFDEKHPTDRGHKLIGNALFEAVEEFDWKESDDD